MRRSSTRKPGNWANLPDPLPPASDDVFNPRTQMKSQILPCRKASDALSPRRLAHPRHRVNRR